jgi:hypothetical protein
MLRICEFQDVVNISNMTHRGILTMWNGWREGSQPAGRYECIHIEYEDRGRPAGNKQKGESQEIKWEMR